MITNRWMLRLIGLVVFMGMLPLMANLRHSYAFYEPELKQILENHWVDSIYSTFSDEQKIGQLFMIRAHSDKSPEYEEDVAHLIRTYHVGGLCFFQGTPRHQAGLTNYYQSLSSLPLMIAMDAEWGLGMRLTGPEVVDFPRQITLGAIENEDLIFSMGKEVARQLRRIGVHINFAPVADINNNPNNPVINFRSFGEDRVRVTDKSIAYMNGLQDGKVMACAKHFPGHGDTDVDSHKELPVIRHHRQRLDSVELYPFRQLVQEGLESVMVAHLHIPALDDTFRIPTTLSHRVVTNLLRQEIGFEGVIFTDAMEMKGVSNYVTGGEAELQALLAGNDVLLLPSNLPLAFAQIQAALVDGRLSEMALKEHVTRILHYKYRIGLYENHKIILEGLEEDLRTSPAIQLVSQLIEQSLTLVRNKEELIPFKNLADASISCINIGGKLYNPFQETLLRYADLSVYHAPKDFSKQSIRMWIRQLRHSDIVIVGLFSLSPHSRNNFGLNLSTLAFLKELSLYTKVVLVHFGNPYGLRAFDDFDWVIQANQEDVMTQIHTAAGMMGHALFKGKLPVSASFRSPSGTGLYGDNLFRLGYDRPENVGMSEDTLQRIDDVIEEILREKAAPGGQIMVVKNRKVVYDQSFGQQTYDLSSPEVDRNTLYDLASITKVAATTLAVMKLHEAGSINVFEHLGLYLPASRNTKKEKIRIKDVLHHQAGLASWIPFYQNTLVKNKPGKSFYHQQTLPGFQIPVADHLWMRNDYHRIMGTALMESKQQQAGRYLYSDIGFILLKEMVEAVTDQPFDQWLQKEIFTPLGMRALGFNPLNHFSKERIAPTEEDDYFRMQRIHGHVHDMTAAMYGGVSGHSGLFSNAHDLAILFQMLLNGGFYGGKRYFKPETIRQFTTRCPDCPRRGMGFDMTDLSGSNGHISPLASDRAFGHLGFTGTCVWADPEHDLIFIFLSNRTYPSMASNKLQEGQYRQRIQSLVYKAIKPTDPL